MQTAISNSVDSRSSSKADAHEDSSSYSSAQAVVDEIQRLIRCSSTNLTATEVADLLEVRFSPQVLASLLSWFCAHPDCWPSCANKTLWALSEITAHPYPSAYFQYSAITPSTGISLPPVSKWPWQNGWSFNCWLYLFPEREKPYIYSFFTADGLGFSAHVENEALVLTTIRQKEKGFKHQILVNFTERTWYMFTVVYVYNRWGRGEICVYLNGELRSRIEASWNIASEQAFTRCSIGGHYPATKSNTFCGRLTNIMGFVTALSSEQVFSIYSLGMDYQGQFRFEADCLRELPEPVRRNVYGGGAQLYNSLLFAYTPWACDPPVLLNRGPKELLVDAFAHSAHALMNEGVTAVTTESVPSALHSLGGMQVIYPLFERIDLPVREEGPNSSSDQSTTEFHKPMESVATDLLHLVLSFVGASPLLARQLVQTRGLLLFATALRNASSRHLTIDLLSRLITAARSLLSVIRSLCAPGTGASSIAGQSYVFKLVRHLHGYVLCNPDVWIRAPLEIQDQLYQFLTTEFLPDLVRFGCVHRTSTVLQFIYTLKHYFSLVDPRKRSGFELKTPDKLPLSPAKEVLKLRANLLVYLKQLVARQGTLLDAEMQSLLNYLLAVEEDENLHDVLYLLITLLVDTPQAVGVPFVRNEALYVAFKRLSVHDESNRVYAIKLLGFHLHFCRLHKMDDLMDRYGLFELMIERLHAASPNLSVLTYNALFEVLTDNISSRPQSTPKCVLPPDTVIHNPQMLRVISELLYRSEPSAESTLVRQIFLQHVLALCSQNMFNRRTVLQLSVWQDCLLRLTPLHPTSGLDAFTLATTMRLFRLLLFHAIRVEREGWRVWIDTLALLHMWLEKVDPFNLSQSPGFTFSVRSQVSSAGSSAEDVGVDLTEPVARRMIQSELVSSVKAHAESTDPEDQPQRAGSAEPTSATRSNGNNQFAVDTSPDTAGTVAQSPVGKPLVSQKPTTVTSPSRQISQTLFLRDFRWSHLHQLLLDDLLCSIEEDMGMISSRPSTNQPGLFYPNRSDVNGTAVDAQSVNGNSRNSPTSENRAFTVFEDPSNGTFAINLVHFLSDCADILISASGGLLPLLAAASTTTGDIGNFETVQGLGMSDALCFTLRVAYLLDLCILHVDLHTIEKQRSMSAGALVRQFARLYLTAAVRDTLESRFHALLPTSELVYQLKLFTDPNDGIRFVTCPRRSGEASTIQSGADPEQTGTAAGTSPRSEVDITSQRPGSTGSSTNAPVAIRSLAGSESRTESEQLARRLLCLHSLNTAACNAQGRLFARLGLCPQPWRFVRFLSPEQLFLLWEWKQQYEAQIAHLPGEIQRLLYALRPTFHYPHIRDKTFLRSVLRPLESPESLLQVRDLNRLQGVIFKSEEVPRVPEFLALSIAYFLSVLMVSKYRDILEPNGATFFAAPPPPRTPGGGTEEERQPAEQLDINGSSSNHHQGSSPVRLNSVTSDHEDHEKPVQLPSDPVMPPDSSSTVSADEEVSESTASGSRPASSTGHSAASQPRDLDRLTGDLNTSLASTAAFLRDLFGEFHAHFAKHLLGSQGQVLLNTGSATLRESQSVIELVMLLCSQEWQSSLQKNAGLAFIELINEGRVASRATQEHIVRVTQEAIILLGRLSADSVQRHALFGQLAAQVASHKREEDRVCDGLIEAARRRDAMSATLLNGMVHRLMNQVWRTRGIGVTLPTQLSHLTGEPPDDPNTKPAEFYRLDCWEDDSRRRRRFSPNPYGSTHPSAVLYDLKEQLASLKRMQQLREQLDTTTSDGQTQQSTGAIPLITNGHSSPPLGHPTTAAASVSEDPSASRTSLAEDSRAQELEDFLAQFEDGIDLTLSTLAAEDAVRFSVPCVLVSFGVGIHGTLTLYKSAFQFERDPSHPINRSLDKKVLVYVENTRSRWSFAEIQAIFSRRYLHRTLALEIFVTSRSSVFLAFDEVSTVQRVVNALPAVGVGAKYGLARTRATTLTSPSQLFADSNMTARWQRREISNFDYLMYLNTIAGRTYNDMNQYPIFPWILTNYTSAELDLNEPSSYRDLSKPIGALDPKRKAYFDERYASWEDDTQPPFHYGTHYSTAAFVLGYLLRLEPFTTLFLNLQSGKFDHPDRTFASIGRTWDNCQRSTSDVKELIPEFFYLPEMFENPNRLNLGVTEDGVDVGSVELPPWAPTPEDFVRVHRQALESDLVSCQLHHWIDLIFGFKQRGPEAVQATNVFHHLTYDGSVDWSKLSDPVLIKAVQDQIQSFGQTPAQLLHTPHPHRNSALHLNPMMFSPLRAELCMVYKFYSNSPVVFLAANTDPVTLPQPGVVTVTANRTLVLSRWNCSAADTVYQSALIHPSSQSESADAAALESLLISASNRNGEAETNNNAPAEQLAETEKDSRPGRKKSLTHPARTNSNPSMPPAASLQRRESTATNKEPTVLYPLGPASAYSGPSSAQSGYMHSLGDDYDQNLIPSSNQFTAIGDNRALIACGYDDCSFRLYALDSGRLVQAVFGHFGTVTCIAHSESQSANYCYLASGSRDCTVKLWIYNARRLLILGNHAESASPLVTLIGHEAEVTAVNISSELGIVLSGSKGGTCLLHSTRGTLLRQLCTTTNVPDDTPLLQTDSYESDSRQISQPTGPVQFVAYHREGYLVSQQGATLLTVYTLNGKVIRASDLRRLAATSAYRLTAVVFSACGRYLLVAGTDGVVWVLRSHNLAPVHAFPRCDSMIRSLGLSKDQHYVLAGLETGSLVVFYIDFGRWHHEFQERYAT